MGCHATRGAVTARILLGAWLTFALVALVACSGGGNSGASSNPAAPSVAPPTATLAACATWAGQQKGTGVPAANGSASTQRSALLAAGGGIKAVSGKYYAAYFPGGFASGRRRVMVALHGTGGSPEAEWNDWQSTLNSRNWGFLGLKYVDDANGSYDDDDTIYSHIKSMVDEVRAACDFGSVSMVLVGFSRGSAEAIPVAYLDSRDRRFFSAAGNNSGAWTLGGSPTPTLQTVQNSNNRTGMSGTRFWMYCGEKDFDHGYPMCDEMVQAQTWVRTYGGTVQTLYRDPTGAHGGLTRNASAIDQMFSYFESLP